MDRAARNYAVRVLAYHSLLLALVIATVVLASREVYARAREQSLAQAQARQEVLASQTARGIETFYSDLVSDLDLLRRSERANLGQHNLPPLALAPVMMPQLQARVAMIFAYAAGSGTVLRSFGDGPQLSSASIAAAAREWLGKQTAGNVSLSGVVRLPAGLVNLLALPVAGDRSIVAVIPLRSVQAQFFNELNQQESLAAMLLDAQGNVILDADDQVGAPEVPREARLDPIVRDATRQSIALGQSGTQVFPDEVMVGGHRLRRALATIEPVPMPGGERWWFVVASGMAETDAVISTVFRRSVFWAGFVIVSMTAIVLSTTTQLIRGRMRLERAQAEVMAKELTQARHIQLAWLPKPEAKIGPIDIAAVNHPANHISGDFYNWFELPDGRTLVMIGDVTGHGMSAAFLMATTQLLVRTIFQRSSDVGACLTEVNHQLSSQVYSGQFVTMLILLIDTTRSEVEVATAGHPQPLVGEGGEFLPMPVPAQLVLGVDDTMEYRSDRFPLVAGSSLVLYTDGVTDIQSPSGERFTDEGLRRSLFGRYEDAPALLAAAVQAVDAFRSGTIPEDDVTLVALQWAATPDSAKQARAPQQPMALSGL